MTPNTSQQKALLLLGPGGNGKSRYLAAVRNFLGRRNVSALSLQKLEANTFATASLVGKLANICADLPSKHLTDTSMFKAIVDGGEAINAERKHKDAFDFVPYARLAFSANTAPQSNDSSEGFFDRWLVLEFTNTFRDTKHEIPRETLDAMLVAELPGALNRTREAWLRLRSNRHLSETESTRAGMELFRSTTDPFAIWLDRATVTAPSLVVVKEHLRAAYIADCNANSRTPMSATAFSIALKRLRPSVGEGRPTIAGEQRHCWVGLGLRTGGE
jgi:putative DNA primase/helicase